MVGNLNYNFGRPITTLYTKQAIRRPGSNKLFMTYLTVNYLGQACLFSQAGFGVLA